MHSIINRISVFVILASFVFGAPLPFAATSVAADNIDFANAPFATVSGMLVRTLISVIFCWLLRSDAASQATATAITVHASTSKPRILTTTTPTVLAVNIPIAEHSDAASPFASNEECVIDDITRIYSDLDSLVDSWKSAQDVADSADRAGGAVQEDSPYDPLVEDQSKHQPNGIVNGGKSEADSVTPILAARYRDWRTDEQRLRDDVKELKDDVVTLIRSYASVRNAKSA
jgi:hypothetical protein